MKKIIGIAMLAIGFGLMSVALITFITNDDTKKVDNDEYSTSENQCVSVLKGKKYRQISQEITNEKKVNISVLDCIEESTNEYGKIYSSKNDDYSVQIRVWNTDFQTLDSIISYNYSILDGYSSAYLTSDPFQTNDGVNYNLVQAFKVNEKDEIILMNHTIIYPVNNNTTLSIEFSYNIEELDIEYFEEVANSIEII